MRNTAVIWCKRKPILLIFFPMKKKYNYGQEEFIIIKDHHEPVISREMFNKANRILDERSILQEGKAKYSNRYPFSGKIKCGCCGSSYVARYKTRKNGNQYRTWRCNKAVKYGSFHIDKEGNKVGCTGLSIHNEDVVYIMYLVTQSLRYNKKKIIDNILVIIKSVLSMDNTDVDFGKVKSQIKTIETKHMNLIELYISGNITKDEFVTARLKYDNDITRLAPIIDSMEKQRKITGQQREVIREITEVVNVLVNGVEHEEDFYREILGKMVVYDKEYIDVYLNLLPFKWSYMVKKT